MFAKTGIVLVSALKPIDALKMISMGEKAPLLAPGGDGGEEALPLGKFCTGDCAILYKFKWRETIRQLRTEMNLNLNLTQSNPKGRLAMAATALPGVRARTLGAGTTACP